MTLRISLLSLILISPLWGAPKTHDELRESLQSGVRTIASGQVEQGVNELVTNAIGSWSSPKERAEKVSSLRDPLQQVREALGSPKRVIHISTVFASEDYARVRILDRRAGGGILWTFLCEKTDDEWGVFSWSLTANEELNVLFKELDAADYTKPAVENSSPNRD